MITENHPEEFVLLNHTVRAQKEYLPLLGEVVHFDSLPLVNLTAVADDKGGL